MAKKGDKKKNIKKYQGLGFTKNIFRVNFNHAGPQRQFVYIQRFPISYKNSQLVSQCVDFSSYFDWMGQIREYSLRPIMKKIIRWTSGGKWGLATNSVKLKVFDLLRADDVLEVRLWLEKISGHENIYHLSFDWLRFLATNSYDRVATSSLVITCVKIIGHGKAVIVKPPGFLKVFFDYMRPKSINKKPLEKYRTLFLNVNLGKKIRDYNENSVFLFKNLYKTSLENSNLIGNIYFSNYSKWINSTKDLFLYKNNPSLFNKKRFRGEFVTLECKASHLHEAMPFDTIFVKMYLKELYEKGITLKFEIFKRKKNHSEKLADITQVIAFVQYDSLIPRISKIPLNILHLFGSR